MQSPETNCTTVDLTNFIPTPSTCKPRTVHNPSNTSILRFRLDTIPTPTCRLRPISFVLPTYRVVRFLSIPAAAPAHALTPTPTPAPAFTMGGSAFSSLPDAPYTPRMPPDVYRRAMHACHATLRHLFVFVATPIEGPGKTDYGDIDVLVAVERRVAFPRSSDDAVPRTSRDLMATIQGLLGAERAIIHPTGESANLAIRWPRDMEGGVQAGDSSTPETKYIQVDVRICPDLDQFCWVSIGSSSRTR